MPTKEYETELGKKAYAIRHSRGSVATHVVADFDSLSKNFLQSLPRAFLMIHEGEPLTKVARSFGVPRQNLTYHVKKAVKQGLMVQTNVYPAQYKFTTKGLQKFLIRDDTVSVDGVLRWRAHGAALRFVFGERPLGDVWVGLERGVKRRVSLRNWVARFVDVGGLECRFSNKAVTIWVNTFPVESGGIIHRAVLGCMTAAQEVASILVTKYGFKLDVLHPELVTDPQYALPDHFTGSEDKVRYQFSVGAVDYSCGFRELEYWNEKKLLDFLSMPERLRRLETGKKERVEPKPTGEAGLYPLTEEQFKELEYDLAADMMGGCRFVRHTKEGVTR